MERKITPFGLVIFLLGLSCIPGWAQPTIASFAPQSGPIGTAVEIAGTNFSTTPSENIVFFGAARATVTNATATTLTVTVPMGATYQPISVLKNGLLGYSNAPFVVTFDNNGKDIDASAFAGNADFTAGTFPRATVIGDLDGDGLTDVVAANYNSNTVSVFRNNSTAPGSISFTDKLDVAAGFAPWFVAIGDLDGDGKLDLAVTDVGSARLSLLRNTSTVGSISFASAVDFPTESNPFSVCIGDVDGDGKADLAVANTGRSSVSIFRNTSTGPGSISYATKVDFATGSGPASVSFGDLDGDSKPDLAVGVRGVNTISVFRNTSTVGSVSFAARVDFTNTAMSPESLAIGDLDGDNKADLAVVNSDSKHTLSILRNTSSGPGSISYATNVDYATGEQPLSVSIADLNGDSRPDIAVANNVGSTVSVFRNSSVAAGSISYLGKVDFPTGAGPHSLAIGDLDADGKADVVTAGYHSSAVSVIRNTIDFPSTVPTISSFSPQSGPVGTIVEITGTNFSATATNNIVYFGATRAQVTNATSSTLTVEAPTGATFRPMTVTVNGLTAFSKHAFVVEFPNSGFLDEQSFLPKVDIPTGTGPFSPIISDLDSDGKPDLVASNFNGNSISLLENISAPGSISSGSFAQKVDFATGSLPYGAAVGDLDSDGKPDIAVPGSGNNVVSILRNFSSSGSITTSSFGPKLDLTSGTSPSGVAVGDIDGDGRPDVAVTNQSTNTVSLFRNTSAAGSPISFASKVDFLTGTMPYHVALGDLNGDGKPDLAVTNRESHTVSVFRNTSVSGSVSANTFAPKFDLETGTGSYPYGVAIGDLDRDGKADLVISSYGASRVSVFRNRSIPGSLDLSSFEGRVDFVAGTGPYEICIGDVDGDGRPDIISSNQAASSISVLRNTSTEGTIDNTSFAAKLDLTTAAEPRGVSIGDLDGDNKPELVIANYNENALSIFQNSVTAIPRPYIATVTPEGGFEGTTITITGMNFDPIPANNVVNFNGIAATVASSNATSIVTSVPAGATTGKITVTVNGETASSSSDFTVTMDSSPPIVNDNTSAAQQAGENLTFAVNVVENESLIRDVTVEYRTISIGGSTKTLKLSGVHPNYLVDIDASELGELGVEYKFSVTSAGGTFGSPAFATVQVMYNNGLVIPYSSFGQEQSNYRIIATPLDLTANNVSGVFDELGAYDKNKWRIFRYEGGETSELTLNSQILPGLGYWLIARDNPGRQFNTGKGSSVQATTDESFEIDLEAGWNQVGNPYNFKLSWADVQAANPGLPGLRLFNGDFVDGTILNKLEGGFVKVATAQKLRFPVLKNQAIQNGRTQQGLHRLTNPIIKNNWQAYLTLEQGNLRNRISGFGMNKKASAGFDALDGFNMPQFFETYLRLEHNKKEGSDFYSSDIVPPADHHEWEFSVRSTAPENTITLTWDNSYFGAGGPALYLWDEALQRAIDMRTKNSYAFEKGISSRFKVFYGPVDYVKEKTAVNQLVLHSAWPNPASDHLTVSFSLPESPSTTKVAISLTDLLGKETLGYEGQFGAGYHEVSLKRRDMQRSGIYFLKVNAGAGTMLQRVVFK